MKFSLESFFCKCDFLDCFTFAKKNPNGKLYFLGRVYKIIFLEKFTKVTSKTPLIESCFSSAVGCGKNFQSSCSVEH